MPANPAAPSVLRASFTVHSFEIDAFASLGVPALAGFLQEAAGRHAAEMGCGMDALRARGLAWALARQRLEIAATPALGEIVEVATWPTGVERIAALRDFAVSGAGGAPVAKAVTHWLVFDLASRRPVRPGRVLDARFHAPAEHVLDLAAERPPDPPAWTAELRFPIRTSDIDVNLHVTNTSYLGWAIDSVPREVWRTRRVSGVEAHYLAEGRDEGEVVVRLAPDGDGAFVHSILREEDGKELARLRTAWTPRAPR